MATLVISSSPSWFRSPSFPSQSHHPSRYRPHPDLPPLTPRSVPPEPSPEALSPPDLLFEALSPSKPPLEAVSPPDPPDPPDPPSSLVFLLLLNTSCAFSQPVSKAPDLESCLLNMAFVLCDEVASLVYVGHTNFISICWYPADCSVVLCWCDFIHPPLPFIMLVMVSVDSTMVCSTPNYVSLPHPLIQVVSHRFLNLMLGDELRSLVWYLGLSRGLFLYLALLRPLTAVCSSFPAVCSPFVTLCNSVFMVLKSFQLWQLNGLMPQISILHVNGVLLNVYCTVSSDMEFVHLPISSSPLCGFDAGRVLLKIRVTSNTEVLVKGFVAMLKIVDCALAAASILGFISLIVVTIFQGVVSLYSSMVVETRGLLDIISCLSVLYAPIPLCCICFLVIVVWLA